MPNYRNLKETFSFKNICRDLDDAEEYLDAKTKKIECSIRNMKSGWKRSRGKRCGPGLQWMIRTACRNAKLSIRKGIKHL